VKFTKLSALLCALFFLLFALPNISHADEYKQYGTSVNNIKLRVEKFVSKPVAKSEKGKISNDFVDNLWASDKKYLPDQSVKFKLVVTNISDVALANIQVKDFFPQYLDGFSGAGSLDVSNKVVSITIDHLDAGEAKTLYMSFHIVPQSSLPMNQGILCLVNKVQAESQGLRNEDTSQFCVEKEVLGVTSQPQAGPEYALALLGLNAAMLISGISFLRKRN